MAFTCSITEPDRAGEHVQHTSACHDLRSLTRSYKWYRPYLGVKAWKMQLKSDGIAHVRGCGMNNNQLLLNLTDCPKHDSFNKNQISFSWISSAKKQKQNKKAPQNNHLYRTTLHWPQMNPKSTEWTNNVPNVPKKYQVYLWLSLPRVLLVIKKFLKSLAEAVTPSFL